MSELYRSFPSGGACNCPSFTGRQNLRNLKSVRAVIEYGQMATKSPTTPVQEKQLSIGFSMPVMPGRNVLLRPNMTLVMMPKTGKLTPLTQKMFDAILYLTRQQVLATPGGVKAVKALHFFSAPLKELIALSVSKQSMSDPRTLAKKHLEEMRSIDIDWSAPDANTDVIWRSMGMLSEVVLETHKGETWVKWALPPSLLQVLEDVEQFRYTQIDLEYGSRLQSNVAIALYRICRRYKTNPGGLTNREVPTWWVNALTGMPPDDPQSGTRLREWRKVKSESVLKAITEINEQTDILVELLEFKSGRAVTAVQFSVRRKPGNMRRVVQPTLEPRLVVAATELGLALEDMSELRELGYTEEYLAAAIEKLRMRVARADLTEVDSRIGYLRAIIEEMDAHSLMMNPSVGALDAKEEKAVGAAAAPRQSSSGAPKATIETILTEDERWLKQLEQELLELSASEQSVYVEAVREESRSKGLLTPQTARRLSSSEWTTSPLLLPKIVEAYATAQHGPHWRQAWSQ